MIKVWKTLLCSNSFISQSLGPEHVSPEKSLFIASSRDRPGAWTPWPPFMGVSSCPPALYEIQQVSWVRRILGTSHWANDSDHASTSAIWGWFVTLSAHRICFKREALKKSQCPGDIPDQLNENTGGGIQTPLFLKAPQGIPMCGQVEKHCPYIFLSKDRCKGFD